MEIKQSLNNFNIFNINKSVILVATAVALTLFGDSILYSVLPIHAESLGIPLVAVGVLLSINRWIRLITNPLAARVFQKYGAKIPLILSAITGVAVIFIYSQGRGLIIFLLARIIWGLSWSHLRLGNFLVVLGKSDENLGLTMGSMNAIRRLGSTITVLFGGYLIDTAGYRSGMLIIALAATLAVPTMVKACLNIPANIGQTTPQKDDNTKEENQISSDKIPPVICYFTIFINSFIAGFVISSLSLILKQRIGPSLNLFGGSIGIATITGFLLALRYSSYSILSPISGAAVDLWGSFSTYTGITIIFIISLLVFSVIPLPLVTVIMVCIIFFTSTILETILNTAIAESTGGKKAPGQLSVYTSYQDFGAACGPLVGYIVGVYIHFTYAYLLGVVGLIVLLIYNYFTNQNEKYFPAEEKQNK